MNGKWKSGKPEAKVTENGSKMKMRPKIEEKDKSQTFHSQDVVLAEGIQEKKLLPHL